jgi:excisionase family DNA binding protein
VTDATTATIGESGDEFLLPREVATDWRVSTRSVQRLIASGALPAYRIGGALRVRRSDRDEYEARHRIDTRVEAA